MNGTLDLHTVFLGSGTMQCNFELIAITAMHYNASHLSANILLTLSVLAVFVGARTVYDKIRQQLAELTVIVVGAGPIGLTSALIALNCKHVTRLILYEELSRFDVEQRNYQIAIRPQNVVFLKKCGLDFDNLEGIWDASCFYTRVGIYLEYLLNILPARGTIVEFNFCTKFCKENSYRIDAIPGRKLVICCDGVNGHASRALGISDECQYQYTGILGSMAAFERAGQTSVPTPERKIHNLMLDLSAYGDTFYEEEGKTNFALKIFGNSRHRYISLAAYKTDTQIIRTLKTILDKSMMRNIFLKCFNTYKSSEEALISDSFCLNKMKFSPRLSEIKVSQRLESVAYIDDCDMFVITEGDAARTYNFNTGMEMNVGLKGLASLQQFIEKIVWAETEHSIMSALIYKMEHSDKVSKDFQRYGLKEYMFS